MGGLKPVRGKNRGRTDGEVVYLNDSEDDPTDEDGKKRVTFGVIDGMAYVVYEDGSVDIGANGKAVEVPQSLMERIVSDYINHYGHDYGN